MPPARPAVLGTLDRCPEVADVASAFLEEELDDASTRAVAAHLAHCPGCLRFYAELALTILAAHRLGARLGLTSARRAGSRGKEDGS